MSRGWDRLPTVLFLFFAGALVGWYAGVSQGLIFAVSFCALWRIVTQAMMERARERLAAEDHSPKSNWIYP